jgi:hypothetical protein
VIVAAILLNLAVLAYWIALEQDAVNRIIARKFPSV